MFLELETEQAKEKPDWTKEPLLTIVLRLSTEFKIGKYVHLLIHYLLPFMPMRCCTNGLVFSGNAHLADGQNQWCLAAPTGPNSVGVRNFFTIPPTPPCCTLPAM